MKERFSALSNRFNGFHEELAQARERDNAEFRRALREVDGKVTVLSDAMQLE